MTSSETRTLVLPSVKVEPWSDDPGSVLLRFWDQLAHSTTEATLSPVPSIAHFAAGCLYFAVIHVDVEYKGEKNRKQNEFAGCIYLATSPYDKELSIGVVLQPDCTGNGVGTFACRQVLALAFETFQYHRVSAIILEGPGRMEAQQFFIKLGFAFESTRRQGVFCSRSGQWRDAYCLAMLDFEWIMYDKTTTHKAISVWDEMLARHERERDNLLRWESQKARILKKSKSLETVHPVYRGKAESYESDWDSDNDQEEEEEKDFWSDADPTRTHDQTAPTPQSSFSGGHPAEMTQEYERPSNRSNDGSIEESSPSGQPSVSLPSTLPLPSSPGVPSPIVASWTNMPASSSMTPRPPSPGSQSDTDSGMSSPNWDTLSISSRSASLQSATESESEDDLDSITSKSPIVSIDRRVRHGHPSGSHSLGI